MFTYSTAADVSVDVNYFLNVDVYYYLHYILNLLFFNLLYHVAGHSRMFFRLV